MSDNVNHPSHYCDGRKYEPVEVILDWDLDFLLGSAVKYISRCGRKGTPDDAVEDLEKAVWYIQKRIAVMRAEPVGTKTPESILNGLPYNNCISTPHDDKHPVPSITCDVTAPDVTAFDADVFVADSAPEMRLRAV